MSLRQVVKRTAEHLILASGVPRLTRASFAGRTLILAYHNIVPDDTAPLGDLPNHLPLSHFSDHLSALRDTHEVVPLSIAMEAPSARSSKPRAAVTFDDAYSGAVTLGVPELVRQGIPATIFVAPSFVGGGSFWWDSLAGPPGEGLDPAVRGVALEDFGGDDTIIREWAAKKGFRTKELPRLARAAEEDEIIGVASHPGITLGSHSWSHPNLTRVDPARLESELTRSLAWLQDRIPEPLPVIAYPYGRYNPVVAQAAARTGYRGGLGISGGWVPRESIDPYSLPRLNIPRGLSPQGFRLRTAGILPCGLKRKNPWCPGLLTP